MAPPRTLITAGPTQEPIDEVRYISNRSSGRLGIALASASIRRGWPTTLLLGPIGHLDDRIADELGAGLVRFRTAADLGDRLRRAWPDHDLLIMAAAVADYRPKEQLTGKLRREADLIPTIELERIPDLIAGLAPMTRLDQVAIGFALEPAERLLESAREKLTRKALHAVVANPLETMDAAEIEATLVLPDGRELTPNPTRLCKDAFADWLLDRGAELCRRRGVEIASPP